MRRILSNIFLRCFLLTIAGLVMLSVGCKKDDDMPPSDPLAVETFIAKAITTTSATCGGLIVSAGDSPVLSKGVCWSTTNAPTLNDHILFYPLQSDSISAELTGLMVYTKYYVRAFATNSVDTAYGEVTFFTTQGGTVTDGDGHVYTTVSIGTQVWMAENLQTSKYRNGDTIPYISDDLLWQSSPGAYCYYNNSTAYGEIYGGLYNWWAVYDSRQLAPEGWHVPTDADWDVLASYAEESGKLKEKGTSHWLSPNTNATNETGFGALPGGYRDFLGSFTEIRKAGYYWSSTEYVDLWSNVGAWYESLNYNDNVIATGKISGKYGFSVRCVKD